METYTPWTVRANENEAWLYNSNTMNEFFRGPKTEELVKELNRKATTANVRMLATK